MTRVFEAKIEMLKMKAMHDDLHSKSYQDILDKIDECSSKLSDRINLQPEETNNIVPQIYSTSILPSFSSFHFN